MEWSTRVETPPLDFLLEPQEEILCVGSCFADHMGRRFLDELFRVEVNPFGVMYNPVSILHTVERSMMAPRVALFTLGTNHVYRLKATGEIVDNCEKRPQRLFDEEELTVDECVEALSQAVTLLRARRADVKVVLTVSPIRYAKYGFHGSQLSKAVLLSSAQRMVEQWEGVSYFPAYEIVNDELRDYRFYQPDMLHPSWQTVDYIYSRLTEIALSDHAREFIREWTPVRSVLRHRPFRPESEAYKTLMDKTMLNITALSEKYPNFAEAFQRWKDAEKI